MEKKETREFISYDWLNKYTLTSEQSKKLIADKLEKAKIQSEAIRELNLKLSPK